MLRLYDTLLGTNIQVTPLSAPKFTMYVCGPTVYDVPHIGHGRSVLTFDILRRYLEYRGLEVFHVSNITDVDDKIITRAKQENTDPIDLARTYEEHWWKAMDRLDVLRPHRAPRATEWISEIVDMIELLSRGGYTYTTQDGVYLDVSRVADYGLLAQQNLANLQRSDRNFADEKRQSLDFALWKFNSKDELLWETPFGNGRPGWHSECVVMSTGILGHDFDLHGGGLDLKFPHHENERAQAELLGYGFSRHWMHHGFVESLGVKMSKSLGNFTTLTDMLEQFDPRAYRLLVARSHYRSPLEVTKELAEEASTTLRRLDQFLDRLSDLVQDSSVSASADVTLTKEFEVAMDDDLDTPVAMRAVFDAVTKGNSAFDCGDFGIAKGYALQVSMALETLGLKAPESRLEIPEFVLELARKRQLAKQDRDFTSADSLRDQIQALGFNVEDSTNGYRVRPT